MINSPQIGPLFGNQEKTEPRSKSLTKIEVVLQESMLPYDDKTNYLNDQSSIDHIPDNLPVHQNDYKGNCCSFL
jgi:hypothetical protein